MNQKEEIRVLKKHLKITEKSIINYMEENDDEKDKNALKQQQSFNLNNLKIFYVKELCAKLKSLDLRFQDEDEILNKGTIPYVKSSILNKKSDKGYTWEP